MRNLILVMYIGALCLPVNAQSFDWGAYNGALSNAYIQNQAAYDSICPEYRIKKPQKLKIEHLSNDNIIVDGREYQPVPVRITDNKDKLDVRTRFTQVGTELCLLRMKENQLKSRSEKLSSEEAEKKLQLEAEQRKLAKDIGGEVERLQEDADRLK